MAAGAKAGVGIIRDLAPLIVGEDPLNIEKIWEFFSERLFGGWGAETFFMPE